MPVNLGGSIGAGGGGYGATSSGNLTWTAPHAHSGGESWLGTIEHTADSLGTGVYNFIKSSQVPQTLWNVSPLATVYNVAASGGNVGAALHAQKQGLNKALFGGSPSHTAALWGQFLANPVKEATSEYHTDPFVKMNVNQYAPLAHPLRKPWQTALAAGLIVAPVAFSAAARVAYLGSIAKAARVSDEAGTLVREGSPAASAAMQAGHTLTPLSETEKNALRMKVFNPRYTPPTAPRIVYKPGTKAPKAPLSARFMVDSSGVAQKIGVDIPKNLEGARVAGPAERTSEPIALMKSGSHFVRQVFQRPLDIAIQHGFNRAFESPDGHVGLLGRFATARGRAVVDENARLAMNSWNTMANNLNQEAKNLGPNISKEEGRLATVLRSFNVSPEEGAKFWGRQADSGVNPTVTGELARVAQQLVDKGVMRVGANGKMEVNADAFPRLAHVDSLAKQAQDLREGIIKKYGLMDEAGMATRKNLPAEIMGSEQARSDITGAREGDAYLSLRTSVPRGGQLGYIKARLGGTTTKPTSFVSTHHATGSGIPKGELPADAYKSIAQSLHEAMRYMNSAEYRGQIASYGSYIRRRGDEVLVRDPNATGAGSIPPSYRELMNESKSLTSDGRASHRGLKDGIAARLRDEIPGLKEIKKFESDKASPIGMTAPPGYVWVPKSMLGDLTRIIPVERRGIEKAADAVNSGITAMTVYARPGHLLTRGLTNATTNLIQGSFAPKELLQSWKMIKELGGMNSSKVRELAAATGSHATQALPAEGTTLIAQGARKGAAWWARHIDMPFRVHAVLYELRDVGVKTEPQIDNVLAHLRNPDMSGMSYERKLQVDYALHRANRASIMYDGMSDTEREYLARYIWFLPWIQGGTRYAFHVAGEHPLKAWNTIQTAVQGKQQQEQAFPGGVPTLAFGITPLSGGANPLTANFSSFTPFGQIGADVGIVNAPANPDTGILGELNPVYSGLTAGVGSIYAKNSLQKVITDALTGTVSPTPEYNIIHGVVTPPQPNQWYGSTNVGIHGHAHLAALTSQILRALGGAGVPRPTRATNLARSYVSEHEKHRNIRVVVP